MGTTTDFSDAQAKIRNETSIIGNAKSFSNKNKQLKSR
ncbi:hypothetical protein OROGR_006333 [Orobanche gracilis]